MAANIDWSLVTDAATLSPGAFAESLRERAALAARVQSAPPRVRSEHSAPVAQPSSTPTVPTKPPAVTIEPPVRAPDPVADLQAALAAAPSDADRRALLAAAPRRVREQFNAALVYQQMSEDAAPDPYKEFSQQLDTASDDTARRALVSSRDGAFLAEWAWRQRATADDWARRYLERANRGAAGQAE